MIGDSMTQLPYLVQAVARDVHDPGQREAACIVIAADLPPLLQPAPQDVPPLHRMQVIWVTSQIS